MAETAESVAVRLLADADSFTIKMKGAAGSFGRDMKQIEDAATKAEKTVDNAGKKIGRSFDQAAQRSRQLGFQIQDIGAQLSSGTSPFIVLAQQGPQVASALSLECSLDTGRNNHARFGRACEPGDRSPGHALASECECPLSERARVRGHVRPLGSALERRLVRVAREVRALGCNRWRIQPIEARQDDRHVGLGRGHGALSGPVVARQECERACARTHSPESRYDRRDHRRSLSLVASAADRPGDRQLKQQRTGYRRSLGLPFPLNNRSSSSLSVSRMKGT